MGPTAHARPRHASHNRAWSAPLSQHLPAVLTEIRSLLDRPADGERVSRALAEKTLTDGYAHALRLGGERLQVERLLRSVVRAPKPDQTRIAELTGALDELDRELVGLRRLLAALRAHAL
ncbi:MAG: hypothetical protein MSC30_00525 [Gaiellaceae bacterium MAG52_C11]|nr:hypothetical protein [Candidatus Gaiellasilicea maunaloa]